MNRPLDQDRVPDEHVELRERLAVHFAARGTGELPTLAARIGLSADALSAFTRGAHLAGWAAERLVRQLDKAEAEQ